MQYIASEINGSSPTMTATADWHDDYSYYLAGCPAISTTGANGNLIGAYTYVSGSQTEEWDAPSKTVFGRHVAVAMANHVAVRFAG